MDNLISEFLVETNENLQALDLDFVALEKNPANKEIINNIFRSMHTIKGTCGFLGLHRLEKVAHAGENIMDKLREGKFAATPGIISLILEANDTIKGIIEYLEANESEPEGDDSDLTRRLNECAATGLVPGEAAGAASAPAAAPAPVSANKTPDLDEAIDFEPVRAPYSDSAPTEATANKTPDLDEAIDFEPVRAPYSDSAPASVSAVAPVSVPQPAPKPALSKEAQQKAVASGLKAAEEGGGPEGKKDAGGQSIRVGLDVLENLMQMVGELVLTRNQLLQLVRTAGNAAGQFQAPLQRLNHITSELQEGVMQTRMQPIGNAWAKFPRLIRDLSIELNKKIELKMIGADTELDRQMLEAIKDPLTHMVRNSTDHGIEPPDQRHAAGKSDTGTVTLSAYHEGGHIIIKITDDGRGLNADRIKAKAIENGLATEAELSHMTDKQIHQFIFKPGFSTADKVTAVSGRGVGMDVVISNIHKIGGTVDLTSKPGRGSEFIIKLPLTLAIMSVLIVRSATETFAIPQIRVSEIIRTDNGQDALREKAGFSKPKTSGDGAKDAPTDENNTSGIYRVETINGAPVLRIRGRLLPLISVAGTLKIARNSAADNDNAESSSGAAILEPFVVVCEVGSQHIGLLVDQVFHTEEIVVKPIAGIMRNLEVYSGCTILGDGSVIMILDPNGIIKVSGEVFHEDEAAQQGEGGDGFVDRIVNFLTFKTWAKAPKAVPLDLVSRLEEIDATTLEWAGTQRVVQYRGHLMRLVTLDPATPFPEEGILEVIVFTDEDKVVGLVVEEILDIVKQEMDVVSPTGEAGLIGSVVIGSVTMDLIDISQCFARAHGNWLGKAEAKALGGTKRKPHILLVDDSPFFRKFMKPVLSVAGYDVTTAESGIEGLELLRDPARSFDLVVSDIDMPGMTGIEFTAEIRKDELLMMLHVIALSSHTEEDLPGGYKKCGFNAFVTKAERDKLVEMIHALFVGDRAAA